MIVVDLGCAGHGMYDSIGSLIQHFSPSIVFGFDPLAKQGIYTREGVPVVVSESAAWVYSGFVSFTEDETRSRAGEGDGQVECFDLAGFIHGLPRRQIVVKMDVEGAETILLHHLHNTGTDERLKLLLVENHTDAPLPVVDCPVEEWWL